jgi:hypothetical protein
VTVKLTPQLALRCRLLVEEFIGLEPVDESNRQRRKEVGFGQQPSIGQLPLPKRIHSAASYRRKLLVHLAVANGQQRSQQAHNDRLRQRTVSRIVFSLPSQQKYIEMLDRCLFLLGSTLRRRIFPLHLLELVHAQQVILG